MEIGIKTVFIAIIVLVAAAILIGLITAFSGQSVDIVNGLNEFLKTMLPE